MTGGTALILGTVGDNFGAGMTGGMAFVYDEKNLFAKKVNPESVIWQRFASYHWEDVAKGLIARHASLTGSTWARGLLEDWDRARTRFWQVCPKEMVSRLSHPLNDEVATEAAE